MGSADSVEQLQQLAAQIQREALDDDKTPLRSGLALRQELRDVSSIRLQQESLQEFLALVPSFRDIPFRHNNRVLEIGMSLGYAIGDGKATFEDLLQRADAACQLAKRPGFAHSVKWTKKLQTNPLIRISGWCANSIAKFSCTLPKTNVPSKMLSCPCCGTALETNEDTNHIKK